LEKASNCLIIIPAYNEEETIKEVVLSAKKYADVCVIDDGSTDSTSAILKDIKGLHVIYHRKNTHIPGCLWDGMRYAVEQHYDYAISMDAGLSHYPDEIPLFINHNKADLVMGYRKKKSNAPLYRRALSKIGNVIYNICLDFPRSMFRRYYKDITSGFRRYSNKAMKLLLSKRIESKSFDIMVESAYHIYKNKLTISEVPITYRFSNSSLHINVIRDCIKMCFRIVTHSGDGSGKGT
jgi:dolichol-phosphate mannosyltransferase